MDEDIRLQVLKLVVENHADESIERQLEIAEQYAGFITGRAKSEPPEVR